MKVGFITSEYPHPKVNHSAGIGTSIKNLAVALVKKGLEVTVFVYQQSESNIFNDAGVEIHLIKKQNYTLFTWFLYRKHIQNYVNQIVKKKAIDILEAPDWTGITAFMKFDVPLVIRLHGSDAYFCKLEGRQQKFKNFMFEKLALGNAKGYIAPTSYAGKETASIFALHQKKIETIHYGLQLENFENNSPNVYDKNVILYIGTIIRKKGVLELAEIFNKVVEKNPNAQLVLIGSDTSDVKTGAPSTYQLMNKIFSIKAIKRRKYLGKVPYDEVKNYIKNSHVCTFPSFAETLGMVTIECMAMKKPVMNTSIGWAKELIDDGVDGFLVHPSKIEEYSEKLLQLLEDEELCQKMGNEARKKVEHLFDIDKNAEINISYYKSLLT